MNACIAQGFVVQSSLVTVKEGEIDRLLISGVRYGALAKFFYHDSTNSQETCNHHRRYMRPQHKIYNTTEKGRHRSNREFCTAAPLRSPGPLPQFPWRAPLHVSHGLGRCLFGLPSLPIWFGCIPATRGHTAPDHFASFSSLS